MNRFAAGFRNIWLLSRTFRARARTRNPILRLISGWAPISWHRKHVNAHALEISQLTLHTACFASCACSVEDQHACFAPINTPCAPARRCARERRPRTSNRRYLFPNRSPTPCDKAASIHTVHTPFHKTPRCRVDLNRSISPLNRLSAGLPM